MLLLASITFVRFEQGLSNLRAWVIEKLEFWAEILAILSDFYED